MKRCLVPAIVLVSFCALTAPAFSRPPPPYTVKDLGLRVDQDDFRGDSPGDVPAFDSALKSAAPLTPNVPRKTVGRFPRKRPGASRYEDQFPCVFEADRVRELDSFGLGGCAIGVNDGGDIVGYRYETQDSPFGDFGVTPGVTQAALWIGAREHDLWGPSSRKEFPDPHDITSHAGSRAFAINNKGVVVGEWYGRAVLWDGPTGRDLNALIPSRPYPLWLLTSARRIDDQGRIITVAREALNHGRRFGAAHWLLLAPSAPLKASPPSR